MNETIITLIIGTVWLIVMSAFAKYISEPVLSNTEKEWIDAHFDRITQGNR